MTEDLHPGRDHRKLLARLLADPLQLATIQGADLLLGGKIVEHFHPGKRGGQRTTALADADVSLDLDGRFRPHRLFLVHQVLGLVEELKLIAGESLAARSESFVEQEANLLAKALQLELLSGQFRFQVFLQSGHFQKHRPQAVGVIGEGGELHGPQFNRIAICVHYKTVVYASFLWRVTFDKS